MLVNVRLQPLSSLSPSLQCVVLRLQHHGANLVYFSTRFRLCINRGTAGEFVFGDVEDIYNKLNCDA